MFADSAHGDWTLSGSSPGWGRGMRMTGINTSLDGPLYSVAPALGVRALTPLADVPHPGLPGRFLARALPNPVRAEGAIVYALPTETEVTVRLYDPAGRVVVTLLNGVRQTAGEHRVRVRSVRPGLYFFRVQAGDSRADGRIVVLE